MNINKVYNTSDLQALGSVNEVILALNKAMTPYKVDPDIDTYEDLLPYIIRAKKIELYEPGSFFVSKKHEYINYLTQHDNLGEIRRKIGCKDSYFEDENIKDAKRWYYSIAHIIRANNGNYTIDKDITKAAFHKLEFIRKLMKLQFDDEPKDKQEASV